MPCTMTTMTGGGQVVYATTLMTDNEISIRISSNTFPAAPAWAVDVQMGSVNLVFDPAEVTTRKSVFETTCCRHIMWLWKIILKSLMKVLP